jgi:D-tagatose-1,6-bisphosphate aldolase subunit GatZ/KbaZ
MKALQDLLRAHKAGSNGGIYSVCSAHPLVIEAALRAAERFDQYVLIESTSNQVNQFGGYSGMTPDGFQSHVKGIAQRAGFPVRRALLGGDHLGPNCWRDQPSDAAMQRSATMIAAYVAAGYRKIHLDCSMACADDPPLLTDSTIAARAAQLCSIAESSWRQAGGEPPLYVIGTEVPVPGGAAEELETLAVTTPAAVEVTLDAHRTAFGERGLDAAWQRVIALVVQPGVEFDHHKVIDYEPAKARALSACIEPHSGLVFEAHSTDYQTPAALAALVHDHFAILKVGPAVTFALREALWALADIDGELHGGSDFKTTVLDAMRANPGHWRPYYHDAAMHTLDMQYSLSDRIRYYWTVPQIRQATDALLGRLTQRRIPLTLLSQYLPDQYAAVRAGALANDPRELVIFGVTKVLRGYADACIGASGSVERGHERV